jgi:arachidonate 15-lipoxygenase
MAKAYGERSLFPGRHNLNGWSFKYDAHIPNNLKLRGFGSDARPHVQGYRFAEDAQNVWNLITEYVRVHVEHAYGVTTHSQDQCSEALQNDKQFHSVITELNSVYLANISNGVEPIRTCSQLTEFLTSIVWTCSAQHSAVNFGQLHWYANPTVRPLSMYREMPQGTVVIVNVNVCVLCGDCECVL